MRLRRVTLWFLASAFLVHCGSVDPGEPGDTGLALTEDASREDGGVIDDAASPTEDVAKHDGAADESVVERDVALPNEDVVHDDAPVTEDASASIDAGGVHDVATIDHGAPTNDRGVSVDRPRDTGSPDVRAPIDVPRDAGSAMDVPADRGSPVVDVPVDRGSPTTDRGSPVIDVPVDRGSPVIDVPVDRGSPVIDVPRDTGVDAAIDRPVITDRPSPADVRDVPAADVGRVPADDPVAYSGGFSLRSGRFSASLTVLANRRSVTLVVPRSLPTNAPLVLAFHGTNGAGDVMLDESGAARLAEEQGVIVAAPTSRWLPTGDFDHAGAETYWETAPNLDPDRNQDVVLVRAIIQEARRVFRIDPTRVYAIGHSNGGFFSYFVSQLLRDRVAAFSENAGGLVRCTRRAACGFQGRGATCAALASQRGWCNCTGPELPVALATSGRRPPGLLVHGTADPLVSVYYTCALEGRMRDLGYNWRTILVDGEGHVVSPTYAQTAWSFLAPLRLAP